jgi:crossover junction endodeoxyribonuclease RuvC
VRVLGIDPGSRITGYGVIDGDGRACRAVCTGTFRLGDGPLPGRLLTLHRLLSKLLEEHAPAAVAIEGIFSQRAPRSALVLGHARGVAMLCAAQAELPIFEYPPATVKRSLTSGGAASKGGVARAVAMVLGLKQALAVDATDALAVAICHLGRVRGPSGQALVEGRDAGRPGAWVRALAEAPARRQTPQNALLEMAARGRAR